MKTKPAQSAFTLIELLTVIAIVGILAAIAVPNLGKFKPNVMGAATRQMLDDVTRARQLAISQRTTVYMVFVPAGFWSQPAYNLLSPDDQKKADTLLEKQLVAYNFVSLRSLGDQPGAPTARYLSQWKALPDGTYLVPQKFGLRVPAQTPPAVTNQLGQIMPYVGFLYTTNVPFPRAESPRGIPLPYLAFNFMGQLVNDREQPTGMNEYLPLALGSVGFSRDPETKIVKRVVPSVTETPRGNSTNAFNVVNIDWLTGRARLERLEVR